MGTLCHALKNDDTKFKMTLWISTSQHHNNWYLAQHTPVRVDLLLACTVPGQLSVASFLSRTPEISCNAWKSNSPVPLHGG